MNIEVVFQPFACSQTSCANGTEGKVPRRGNAGAEGTCICHFERLRIALQLHFLALGPQGEEKRQLLSQALGIEERSDSRSTPMLTARRRKNGEKDPLPGNGQCFTLGVFVVFSPLFYSAYSFSS